MQADAEEPIGVRQAKNWLDAVQQSFDDNVIPDNISWTAFHANLIYTYSEPAITTLLPLFTETAHSVAMIKHGMSVIKQAVGHLNTDQIPVIALDQPLFATGKLIQ